VLAVLSCGFRQQSLQSAEVSKRQAKTAAGPSACTADMRI
jgi:hypothetical protein